MKAAVVAGLVMVGMTLGAHAQVTAGPGTVGPPAGANRVAAGAMTAAEAWGKIQKRYMDPPPADTVDTLKGGDPATPVTGIVTTFLDTMYVLREAVRLGDNLVITHEPTFYNHRDETAAFTSNPVYREKAAYIAEHHLVVYRLHDEIHADPEGDQILVGLYDALGWAQYPRGLGYPGETAKVAQYFVTLPPTTLGELAKTLEIRLHAQTMRVDGDPAQPVTRVALLPGAAGLEKHVRALNAPGVDVLVAGEASEWETVEYVRDATEQGRKKGMILLGHEVSEEPGMEQCAKQLRVLFPGLKVDHVLAGQALWSPDHPVTPKLP